MKDAVYEVYETDADDSMDMDRLVHIGRSKDVAETIMFRSYQASHYTVDFLLYDSVKKHIAAFCLSPATAMRRGICQG